MENNKLALWNESVQPIEVNFDKLKKNRNTTTIMGVPVKIDKVLYDLSGETIIGLTGTLSIKGTKLRAVWDIMGNILEFRNMGILRGWNTNFRKIFEGLNENMFNLVISKPLDDESEKI